MDTERDIYDNSTEDREVIIEHESNPFHEPKSKLEYWLVAIACATFFPLVYLIGKTVKYLLR